MNYQFGKLEHLISVIINPHNFALQKCKAAFIKKNAALMYDESSLAKLQLWNEFINCDSDQQVRNYLQHHQRAIVKLLDTICEFETGILKEKVSKNQIRFYIVFVQNSIEQLEKILVFLQGDAKEYFQHDASIPLLWKRRNTVIVKQLQMKVSLLIGEKKIDEEFYKMLSDPLTTFILDRSVISFRDFYYLKTFVSNLEPVLENTNVNNEMICDFLLANNFNQLSFFNYYIKYINTSGNTEIESLTHMYGHLKKVNQVPRKSELSYNKGQSSIFDQIGTWLAEEIYFIEKKLTLLNPLQPSNLNARSFSKLQTSLSVPQLSLAIKMLLDTGVIKSKNTSDIMRMVASNFRTEKSESISEDSLRNKAYNIERSAINGMRDIIINFLNTVRKY